MGEKERYTQLNAEFQRIVRRDKKALNEQYKEIAENNRMSKTRDLFKKIGDIKGLFHARMGTMNSKTLTNRGDFDEVERIHRRTVQERS